MQSSTSLFPFPPDHAHKTHFKSMDQRSLSVAAIRRIMPMHQVARSLVDLAISSLPGAAPWPLPDTGCRHGSASLQTTLPLPCSPACEPIPERLAGR